MNQDLLIPTKVEILTVNRHVDLPPTPSDPLVKNFVNFNVFLEGKWRHKFDSKLKFTFQLTA